MEWAERLLKPFLYHIPDKYFLACGLYIERNPVSKSVQGKRWSFLQEFLEISGLLSFVRARIGGSPLDI